jgi:hypothetical protein
VAALSVDESAGAKSTIISQTKTDDSGRYRLEGILAGNYLVIEGALEAPTYYPGVIPRKNATIVVVAEGAALTGIDFQVVVPSPVRVSGHVVRDDMPPGARQGGQVRLTSSTNSAATKTVNIDANGRFEFSSVQPGSYQALVQPSQRMTAVPLTIDSDIEDLELVVPLSVRVDGNIMVEGGQPRPRTQIQFTSSTLPAGQTSVGLGTFQAFLPKGEFRIEVPNLPPGYFVKSLMAGTTDLTKDTLNIDSSSENVRIGIVLGVFSDGWVPVRGRLNGAETLALAQSAVLASAAMEGRSVLLHQDGTFEFPKVPPGTYTLGFRPGFPFFPTASVTVGEGGLENVLLSIARMKEISGQVSVRGVPVKTRFDVRVDLLRKRPSFPNDQDAGNQVTETTSQVLSIISEPDGKFTISLPEGVIKIQVVNMPGMTKATYGAVNVLNETFVVPQDDGAELILDFPSPPVQIILSDDLSSK